MRKNILLLLAITLAWFTSCKKEESPTDWSQYLSSGSNLEIEVSFRRATLSSFLEKTGTRMEDYGHCWDTVPHPDLSSSHSSLGYTAGGILYSSELVALEPGRRYYSRAFLIHGGEVFYGVERIFTTLEVVEPEVQTDSIRYIFENQALASGSVSAINDDSLSACGFCWNTNGNPVLEDNKVQLVSPGVSIHASISGLERNTTYFIRAFASNSEYTAYGDELSFTTGGDLPEDSIVPTPEDPIVPTVELHDEYLAGLNFVMLTVTVGEGIGYTIFRKGISIDTSPNPGFDERKYDGGREAGTFSGLIDGLNHGSIYYVRAFVDVGDTILFSEEMKVVTSLEDIDGNIYETVIIGDQAWMAQDLKTTHYANGTPIPIVEDDVVWEALGKTGRGMCWFENSAYNGYEYGGLYTWATAVDLPSNELLPEIVQGACPDGWRMPGDDDWNEMEIYLGMPEYMAENFNSRGFEHGHLLREVGTDHWREPNEGATNESGFTALPGGGRQAGGDFFGQWRTDAVYWTSTPKDIYGAFLRVVQEEGGVIRSSGNYGKGQSVRCIAE